MASSSALAPPHPSSTLVNVAEHAELRLVQLLAESSAKAVSATFLTDCEKCIGNADASGLLRTILSDPGAISGLLSIEPYDEAVGAFSLLASLLERVGDGSGDGAGAASSKEDEAKLASDLANAVANGRAAAAAAAPETEVDRKRVAMLAALYNLRSDGTEKCRLLSQIVTLAAGSDPDSVLPGRALGDVLDAANVKNMVEGWGVGNADRRNLYRAISDGVGVGGGEARKQTFLLLLLESYADASEVNAEALSAAKDAAVGAIRDPVTLFAEQRGMLSLPPVAALGANKATKSLFELLQIFQEGKLEDFEAFVHTNESTLTEYSLSKDECVRHMRLLSLCSLASEHEEIPYSAIASTLHVPDDDVEGWVIAAVSSGLLSAKMDQLQGVVMVERCVIRRFGIEQWKALQGRLDVWRKNVRGVLEGLKQQSQAVQQQQQSQPV